MLNKIKTTLYPYTIKLSGLIGTDMTYLIKNGFWINFGNIASSIISLVLSIIFAKYVSKEIFGTYKYIISTVSVISAFSLTGMNTAVIRAVAQGFDGIFIKSIKEQFKWVWPQFFLMLCFSSYYLYQNNLAYGLSFLIIGVISPLSGIANTYRAVLMGKKDFKKLSIYGLISNFFYFFVMVFIVFKFSSSVLFLILGYYCVNAFTNIYFCIKLYKEYDIVENTKLRTEDILYGKHISIMNVIGAFASQLDSILIYHFLGPASLAIYSFAIILPEKIRSLFGFISELAFPKIAEKSQSGLKMNLKNKIIQLILVGLVVSGIYIMLAPLVFHWFFPQYSNAILYSQIFSISLIAIALNISNTALIAQRKQEELYYTNTFTPIVKIILTIGGVWYFGIWGAIISRIVGHVVTLLVTSYFLKNK